jgi:mannosyl-glycoprotein endo-beta-N-acetylglucosaminidase
VRELILLEQENRDFPGNFRLYYQKGTFITEFDNGFEFCNKLLRDESVMLKVVDALVDMTVFYGFDGWLLNIENRIKAEHLENLVRFVELLTRKLHELDSDLYRVVWYDSVVNTGDLKWQNELNNSNRYRQPHVS